MSAIGWAAWIALGLWCVALVVGVVAFFMARALWWQIKPQVAPLIAMFAAPPADARLSAGYPEDHVKRP